MSGNVTSKLESNIHLLPTVIQWLVQCHVPSKKTQWVDYTDSEIYHMAWMYAIPQYDNWFFFRFFSVMPQKNIMAEMHSTFILNLPKYTFAYVRWYIMMHIHNQYDTILMPKNIKYMNSDCLVDRIRYVHQGKCISALVYFLVSCLVTSLK